jgi:tetratricopeptide (TPR) repeat protein
LPEFAVPLTSQFIALPDPGQAATLDDLAECLRNLKAWAGNPSYETITGRVNAHRPAAEQVGKTTVVDCFRAGRRRVDADLVVAVVEALHADLGYVTQWRQALRVIVGETRAAAQVRVQDSLPQDLSLFTGRRAELDRLRTLAARSRVDGEAVVISALAGMAGVGKTQLALHVGHLLAAEEPFDQILFVNLRGFHPDPAQPPADPGAVLDGFLRLLGVAGQHVPHQLAARTEAFRQRLTGLRSLVVLDNAADGRQVAPLLPGVPGCVTLVTSRRDLGEVGPAARFAVDVFTPDEALQYLATAVPQIPVGSDPEAASRIAGRCGHLPLALALVAGHIRAKPDWSLTDHADWLDERHEDRRLDSGVELALEVSYRNLPVGERALLRLLALHPGQDFDDRAAAALAGLDLPVAETRLAKLLADNLLMTAGPGRYQLHDLVQAYAAARSADEDRRTDRRAAVTRLLDHYLSTAAAAMNRLDPAGIPLRPAVPEPVVPLPDLTEPLSWLEAERPNLIAAVTYAAADDRPEHTTRLAVVISRYLLGRYSHDALLVHGYAATAAREAGDEIGYAVALAGLGTTEIFRGRHEAAARTLGEALAVFRRSDRPREAAGALTNLGIAKVRLGRYEEAVEHSEESLALYQAVGDRVGQARASINLGNLAARREYADDAVTHYREALEIYRENGDRAGEGIALGNLGAAETKRGRYDSAQEYLARALALHRELRKRHTEANTIDSLGLLSSRRGDGDRAEEYHRQALAIFLELGDRGNEACAHNGLGLAAQVRGRPEQARAEHARALAIAGEPDVDDRAEQARAHTGLAEAYRELGVLDEARGHFLAAQALWQKLGSLRAAEVSRSLAALGE